jgi:hypothetical protein
MQATEAPEAPEATNGVPKVPAVPSEPRNNSQLKPEAKLELLSRQLRNNRKCKPMVEAPESAIGCQANAKPLSLSRFWKLWESERSATRVVTHNSRSLRERKFHNARTLASPQTNARVAAKPLSLSRSWRLRESEQRATRVVTHNTREKIPQCPQDTSPSTVASPQTNARVATERDSTADTLSALNTENEETDLNTEPEDQIQSIRTLLQCLLLRQHRIRPSTRRVARGLCGSFNEMGSLCRSRLFCGYSTLDSKESV